MKNDDSGASSSRPTSLECRYRRRLVFDERFCVVSLLRRCHFSPNNKARLESRPLFALISSFFTLNSNVNWKKCRCCAWVWTRDCRMVGVDWSIEQWWHASRVYLILHDKATTLIQLMIKGETYLQLGILLLSTANSHTGLIIARDLVFGDT